MKGIAATWSSRSRVARERPQSASWFDLSAEDYAVLTGVRGESHEGVPGRGRLCIQDSTSDANQAIRPGPMRRRAGKRLRATYL